MPRTVKHAAPRKTPAYLAFYILVVSFLLGYALFKGFQVLNASLFASSPERINIVLYGPETSYYSLDMTAGRHYQIVFPPDLKVDVPGGYGQYRVGSLGRLAELDDNAYLLQKTFASTTTTFIHYSFYPSIKEVYYGTEITESSYKPSIRSILFQKSNAGILDRLYLALHLLPEKDTSFANIRYSQQENQVLGETVFNEETFQKNSLGLLYQSRYRDEQESVQILYPRQYRTANRIGTILQGNGIRVSDISLDIERSDTCVVYYSAETPSLTARDIAEYFRCPLTAGKTDVYDVIFKLGNREGEWEI